MTHKGFNTNKLLDKLDIEVRNAKIAILWDYMSNETEKSYKERVRYLMKEYYLSYGRIEDIIQERFGEED